MVLQKFRTHDCFACFFCPYATNGAHQTCIVVVPALVDPALHALSRHCAFLLLTNHGSYLGLADPLLFHTWELPCLSGAQWKLPLLQWKLPLPVVVAIAVTFACMQGTPCHATLPLAMVPVTGPLLVMQGTPL